MEDYSLQPFDTSPKVHVWFLLSCGHVKMSIGKYKITAPVMKLGPSKEIRCDACKVDKRVVKVERAG